DFLSHGAMRDVQRVCEKQQIGLSFLPRMLGLTERTPSSAPEAAPEPSQETAFTLPSYFVLKRWIDVVGSLVLIALFSPVLGLGCVLSLLDVGLPVLFWQERVGRNSRAFLIYKFRTLRAPFTSDGSPAALEERQPSAIGRLLRATRIDELPQLLNV